MYTHRVLERLSEAKGEINHPNMIENWYMYFLTS